MTTELTWSPEVQPLSLLVIQEHLQDTHMLGQHNKDHRRHSPIQAAVGCIGRSVSDFQ